MSAYEVSTSDKVLLLGEGNFSFCKDFLILNEKLLGENFNSAGIVASCRENESDSFSEFKQDNIKFIISKGVTVCFNVDATNLKCHPEIKDQKFDKIIFNFPHVGGKMRIDLNRKLLKDFFASACEVLKKEGCIVVALCDGQGGTEADKRQRNWNDSWQVTEMAAQSDLILFKVEPFDVTCFPHYVNVGYRSCDKSFHCENAIVHLFRKQQPPYILQVDSDHWTRLEGDYESLVLNALEKLLTMPWLNPHSASSYMFERLIEILKSSVNFSEHKSVVTYHLSLTPGDVNPSVASRENLMTLMDIFESVNDDAKQLENNNMIVKGMMIKKLFPLEDFQSAPVRCQVLLFGSGSSDLLFQYLTSLLQLFKSDRKIYINDSHCKFTLHEPNFNNQLAKDVIETVLLPNEVPCCVIHIDELAELLFHVKDWRSLWDGSIDVSSSDNPVFRTTVIYPKDYSFDLGLSVPLSIRDRFDEDFYLTLWLLAGDMIVKIKHLTTYEPTDRDLICYCYRITYKSYNAPLHRKRVIYLHEKIIAKVVSRILQVNIT